MVVLSQFLGRIIQLAKRVKLLLGDPSILFVVEDKVFLISLLIKIFK